VERVRPAQPAWVSPGAGRGAAIGVLVGAEAGVAGAGFTSKRDIERPRKSVAATDLGAPFRAQGGSGNNSKLKDHPG
jgi:hypothetical protein